MSSAIRTKGITLTATAAKILPDSVHRKGLFLHAIAACCLAFGGDTAPAVADYFKMKVGETLILDNLVPSSAVWAIGAGILVVGEAM